MVARACAQIHECAWRVGHAHTPQQQRCMGHRARQPLQPPHYCADRYAADRPGRRRCIAAYQGRPHRHACTGHLQQLRQWIYAVGHLPHLRRKLQQLLWHNGGAGSAQPRAKALRHCCQAKHIQWEAHEPRFDYVKEPNESNRFGWIVEIDPFNPTSTPKNARHWDASSMRTQRLR